MLRALGPLPITPSSLKSSSAGSSPSSTVRGMRWTSSTNRTSPSSRLVRMAARSPARSSAGPDVGRNPAPISLATIPASVVLPSPGGPESNTWSIGSPRPRAPSISRPSCSLMRGWPTNSWSHRGRRATSSDTSSSADASATTRRSSFSPTARFTSSPPYRLECLPKEFLHRPLAVRSERRERFARLLAGETEGQQGLAHFGQRARHYRVAARPQTILQVEDDARGDFPPNAGDEGQRVGVSGRDRSAQGLGRQHRQDGHGELRPNPVHGHQLVEQRSLV